MPVVCGCDPDRTLDIVYLGPGEGREHQEAVILAKERYVQSTRVETKQAGLMTDYYTAFSANEDRIFKSDASMIRDTILPCESPMSSVSPLF